MYDNVLVDGKNIIYRAVAAARSSGYQVHPVTIMLRMMDRWRREFKPKKWNVFWDVPKANLWRKKLYPEYKEGRPVVDEDGYRKRLIDSQKVAAMVLQCMAMTQYIRKRNEADDLIYAFAITYEDQKNLIVSSDGDMTQIPYRHNVDLYNPASKNRNNNLVTIPEHDPVIVKSLAGDKSDNINNYRLVKDKTAKKIIDKGLDNFLESKGRELFDLNRQLVDLSINPELDENIEYIKSVEPNDVFDMKKIQRLIAKYHIDGLYEQLNNVVRPFKYN